MPAACRLAGLSALEGHYAGLSAPPTIRPSGKGGDTLRQHWPGESYTDVILGIAGRDGGRKA
jgi:hypothetical protein